MKIAQDVDAGDVVDQQRVQIDEADTIADVLEKVTSAYLVTLEKNIFSILDGTCAANPQEHSLAAYTVRDTSIKDVVTLAPHSIRDFLTI